MSAADRLRDAAEIHKVKEKEYGRGYNRFGFIMSSLFPKGIHISPAETHKWIRLGLFQMQVHKLIREADDLFSDTPNLDHSGDLTVYSAILQSVLAGDP